MTSEPTHSAEIPFPDDLPPVRPPSVGFIVQLFVVPGLIVAAIVGIWLLFGRVATAEHNWRRLVVELQNPNEHRRWRGAMGLAQILKADQELGDKGQHLSEDPEFVSVMTDLFGAELEKNGQRPADLQFQAFLAQTFGLLDSPDSVLPILSQAMRPGLDREVRKNALLSIAIMVDRLNRRKQPMPTAKITIEVVGVSQDADPLMRLTAAYTLGLIDDADARNRLKVMLGDESLDVRVNAAVALARHNDRSGLAVLQDVLATAGQPFGNRYSDELSQFLAVKNSLMALNQLIPLLIDSEKTELQSVVKPISDSFREPAIRVAAQSTLHELAGTK
ncbi:MAG: HEAT repeat domain-containing protein [Planctomycetota bacterium]|nr:HEAT repeat domain-containing protein [Planctomycetota bacterium]